MTGSGRDGRIVTFYSYKGGTGRTMALANVAWILAGSGRRVLAVDWDLESPGLHRFFHPFLDLGVVADTPGVIDLIRSYQWHTRPQQSSRPPEWYRQHADVSGSTLPLDWEFPAGGALHFMGAGRQNQDYSATLASVNWDEFYEQYDGGQFFDALRATLKEEYDFVLIDSRTGLSDIAQICTLQLPDVLVALFTFSDQGIDGVAAVTHQVGVQYARRNIRILPVPTRVDDAEKEKADNSRAYARRRFAGLPQGMDEPERIRYWGEVEVPYRAFYAYEETLAVFGDRADAGPGTVRAALERLARRVADDPAVAAPELAEADRLRVIGSFTRRAAAEPGGVVLCYAPENRMWADWLRALLERHGLDVLLYDADSPAADPAAAAAAAAEGRVLAVLSPAFARSRAAMRFARQAADADPGRSRGRLCGVYVAETRALEVFADRSTANLTRLDERAASEAVLAALGIADAEPPGRTPALALRYPGSVPQVWNVAPRNPSFTGRNEMLESLRAQLAAKGSAVVLPVALHGLGGVGKTQVALEYAHRFQADYDLVWWIDAEVPAFIDESLARLAARLDLRVGTNLPDAAREVLELLRLGRAPYQRWLLIYDNANEPADLRSYIPSGPGHVLITSRNQSWSSVAASLEVDVFTADESIEHLTKRLPSLQVEQAQQLAGRLGNLPLAVEVAGAWLAETGTPIADYLQDLEASSTSLLSYSVPVGYAKTIESTWQISLDRLAERNRAGLRLLELCAFMAPSISMDLVHGQQMAEALAPFDPTLRVSGMLGRVVQEISRLALAKIDVRHKEMQIHRLMQDFLRNRLTPKEQEERRHVVHRILAGARPQRGDVDDSANWPHYALIWPHLTPSRAASCVEDPVRSLLIDWVRFLRRRSQHALALDFGQRLATQWSQMLADPLGQGLSAEVDLAAWRRQLLFLRFHLGNVYRAQGEFGLAHALDEEVLAEQRAELGEDDLHTLMTAAGLAGDLRGLGRYREALEMDLVTYDRLKLLFGDDHERTLMAAGNLAVSHRLTGDSAAAFDLDEDTLAKRTQVLGERNTFTLQSQQALGRDYRDLGRYRQSLQEAQAAHRGYLEVLGPEFVETLRAANEVSASLRILGEHERAKALTEETMERFEADFEPDHPDALACQVNLAADLAATAELERALMVAQNAVDRYERQLGPGHPYTNMARVNYGTYLLRAERAEAAFQQLFPANERLLEQLGPLSPFVLGSGINLANAYAATGDARRAANLDRKLQRQLTERLGQNHPMTLICSINLALDLEATGRHEQAEALRRQTLTGLTEVLGEEHPSVIAARAGGRLDQELMPQPI
jgi:MinD-like ATPase involved in chromosome partitioning or flagellar assembly